MHVWKCSTAKGLLIGFTGKKHGWMICAVKKGLFVELFVFLVTLTVTNKISFRFFPKHNICEVFLLNWAGLWSPIMQPELVLWWSEQNLQLSSFKVYMMSGGCRNWTKAGITGQTQITTTTSEALKQRTHQLLGLIQIKQSGSLTGASCSVPFRSATN